jgi:MFS transporter, ACS family, pantothenate transporter
MAAAATYEHDQSVAQVQAPKQKPTLGKRILGVLWDSLDDKPPEEHRLVRRLDSFYLIWACFYYFVMYLDSSMFSR